jgi:hypothetical protein
MKNSRGTAALVVFFGGLLVLYGVASVFSALPPSGPAPLPALSTGPAASFTPPIHRSLTPTGIRDSTVRTNMAEAPARWTAVAATNTARGAICMPGYELESPDSIASMSNDQWTIFTCSPRPKKPEPGETPEIVDYRERYTQVIRIDQKRIWTIFHRQFEWSNRPNAFLKPHRWTQDGNSVYLVWDYAPGGDGFYAPGFFSDDVALFRLNLNTGYFESILAYSKQGYAFSLSPDDRLLAYRNPGQPLRIQIRDLGNGGEDQKALFGDYALTGAFAWSPDGAALYFASAMSGWGEGSAGVSLFELTVGGMSMRTILFNDPRLIIPYPCFDNGAFHSWAGGHLLCVTSLDEKSEFFFTNSLLDVGTKKIVPAAAPAPGSSAAPTPDA